MDRIDEYRRIVTRLIEEYASFKSSYGDIRTEAVIDSKRDHYEVVNVGWLGDQRIHGASIHIDIIDGKIWIEYNGTDRPLVDELMEAGVRREDIVLGFQPVELRQRSGFAVG